MDSNLRFRYRSALVHLSQIRRDLWRYAEIGRNGEVLAEDTREMALRWTAAGMLEAERSFRRVRGHKDMAKLVDALGRETTPAVVTPEEYDQAAA